MSPAVSDSFPRQPHLPPELIHSIIENCDKKTLPNCSLVSRTWHSVAAPLLYSKLSMCLAYKGKKFSNFFSFLREGTRLAYHVKSFEVMGGQSSVCQLIRLFGYFPHLRDLTLDRMALIPALVVNSAPPTQPSLPIPHLKSLTIHSVDIVHDKNPWSALFDLINSFSVIDKLVLDSLWSRGFSTGYRIPPPDGLTTISPGEKARIGEVGFLPELTEDVEEFISAMAEHLDATQIHTLETAQWHDRDLFQRVMAAFGGVKHVRFLMRENDEGYYVPLPTSWSSLESITFSTYPPEPGPYAKSETFDGLQEMFSSSLEALSSISQASRTQLSTIRYEFLSEFSVGPGELDRFRYLRRAVEGMGWPNLESILSKNTFGKFQVVEVLATVPRVYLDDYPDEMSIAEYHAKEAKERVVLANIVKDQLPNLTREYTVNVWVRDA